MTLSSPSHPISVFTWRCYYSGTVKPADQETPAMEKIDYKKRRAHRAEWGQGRESQGWSGGSRSEEGTWARVFIVVFRGRNE